ncbi:aspartyl-phosphate phosphatase Spo0E family protein [Sutcliffiella deserti]|uniref:aspartyl-phosphate phosphatase Spo0E family protein n=1 Tax=Sutcliffiella deserti TaxID=2875501 RepID=UPI001CC0C9AA|nr:aspartyl-phosphate phosphatase Spo0E family protein [Sutcliffiella deserti]
MIKIKLIQLAVENKRKQMIQTASKTGFTSNETIKVSQELDKILNVFVPPATGYQHDQLNNKKQKNSKTS